MNATIPINRLTMTEAAQADLTASLELSREIALAESNRIRSILADNCPDDVLTIEGLADTWFRIHQAQYAYVPERGQWMDYSTWEWRDAERMLNDLDRFVKYAITPPDMVNKNAKQSLYDRWLNPTRMNAILSYAQGLLTVHADKWNGKPHLLGLPDGDVADLASGDVFPSAFEDFITIKTNATPAPPQAAWTDFINFAFGGNEDTIASVQMMLGSSLYAGNRDERIYFLHGPTNTGKSTMMEPIVQALGEYALPAAADVFKIKTNRHASEYLPFVTSRLVTLPEMTEVSWSNGLLKAVTSGDSIRVQYMHKEGFGATPTCTLWATSNDMPVQKDIDDAIKRRVVVIPMLHRPEHLDTDLRLIFKNNLTQQSGIMGWLLNGAKMCQDFYKQGKSVPLSPEIRTHTDKYLNG